MTVRTPPRALIAGLIALTACTPDIANAAGPNAPVMQIADGSLRGSSLGDVESFKGVPFAAPPVGALRWREPAPVAHWTGVRDARDFGPPCAQAVFNWNRDVAAQSREDCLYLNVWVPRNAKSGSLPVMIFFPGGANHGGSARGLSAIEPSYDGAKLARRGVIVVTANYRLGIFGFLAHPELTEESPHHASGNYALLDQVAALRWIQANISHFGGNPENVTAMGQSAGSYDLALIMSSALEQGLFAKVIFQSDPIVGDTLSEEKAEESRGVELAKRLGAPKTGAVAALRHMAANEILREFAQGAPLRGKEPQVSVDGYLVREQPVLAFSDGHEARIPMVIGMTAREGDSESMGVRGSPKAEAARDDRTRPLARTHPVHPPSAKDLSTIRAFFGPDRRLAEDAVHFYGDPTSTDPSDGDAMTAFNTDQFRCYSLIQARWHARYAPTWIYQFSHGYEPLGAVHLWDMQYLFGWLLPPADQPRDLQLSRAIQLYWTAFAKSGQPAVPGLPAWPRMSVHDPYLDFASDGPVARNDLRKQACVLFSRRLEQTLVMLRNGDIGHSTP